MQSESVTGNEFFEWEAIKFPENEKNKKNLKDNFMKVIFHAFAGM